jgi:hypothetical protein
MAYAADDPPQPASAVPAMGSAEWLDAHGHPRGTCIHGCRPPAVSWDCLLVQECTNDGCNCHYGAFL